MVGRFVGREISKRPTCPFCGLLIDRPKELGTQVQYEMPMGRCPCGAVFAFDVTGHNLGTAMVNALVFGCHGDWDLAWGLTAEEDYQEGRVEHYDQESHLVVPGGAYEGRGISGVLFFIRLRQKTQQVMEREVPGQGDRPFSPQPFTKNEKD